MIRGTRSGSIGVLLLAQALLASCSDVFEPFAPSDLAFSIFGRVEANADTQWIRVRPMQASLDELQAPIDAVVTLEEIETGVIVEMRDSMFRFPSPYSRDAGIMMSVHTFWTTMPIAPGRHYRLTATRSDGVSSSATVRVPVMNPRVVIQYTNSLNPPPIATVTGVEQVVMTYGDTQVPPCGYYSPIYRQIFRYQGSNGTYTFAVNPDQAPDRFAMLPPMSAECYPLGPKSVFVVTSDSGWGWPYDRLVEIDELALPDGTDNIENGIGFLAGTHQLVFPYEPCTPASGASSCTVIYEWGSPALKWKATP